MSYQSFISELNSLARNVSESSRPKARTDKIIDSGYEFYERLSHSNLSKSQDFSDGSGLTDHIAGKIDDETLADNLERFKFQGWKLP